MRDDGQLSSERFARYATDHLAQTNKFVEKISTEYLKHIQKLETINVPKPVTVKAVQDVLDRTPPMAEVNQIEEQEDDGIEITEQNLNKIPIGRDTKIVFDGGDFPTEIE